MNTLKNAPKASVNFVRRHKVAISVAATAAICIAINRQAINNFNEFLEIEGLTDEWNNYLVS
jgi:hypothetical protein